MVEFEIIEPIGTGRATTLALRDFMNKNKSEELRFIIKSYGGDASDGIAMHDLIKSHPHKTSAIIIGHSASAATLIACACDYIEQGDNVLWLMHNAETGRAGNVFEMEKAASELRKNDAIQVKIYREKSGLSTSKIKALMKSADWLTAEEVKALGFINKVRKTGQKIAADASNMNGLNELLINKLEKKMNLFNKKDNDPIHYPIAFKDGTQCVMNAETIDTGVELAPLGAAKIEDGEKELEDGRKVTVSANVVTGITEAPKQEPVNPDILAAVGEIIVAEIDKFKAAFRAEVTEELGKITSSHKPHKGTPESSKAPKASAEKRVRDMAGSIMAEMDKARKS